MNLSREELRPSTRRFMPRNNKERTVRRSFFIHSEAVRGDVVLGQCVANAVHKMLCITMPCVMCFTHSSRVFKWLMWAAAELVASTNCPKTLDSIKPPETNA